MKRSATGTQSSRKEARPVRSRASTGLRCPACGLSKTQEFFRADRVPVFCNVAFDTAAEARLVPRGDIRLRICQSCGYIYNAAFAPDLLAYTPAYDNALHFSERFRSYAEQLAGRLVERLDLRGKTIIEIGCGDGHFLGLLCQAGANAGIGFDPSHRKQEQAAVTAGQVSFRTECYGPAHAGLPVDFISCRHVLEHIADPLRFLAELRRTIGKRDHVRLYFEMPNALQILRGYAMWDVLYEHCGYYVAPALERLFLRAGFEPLSTWQAYGGQFLSLLARPARPTKACLLPEPAVSSDVRISVRSFAGRFRAKVARWQEYLMRMHELSNRTIFWQAGSRGVTLLNVLEHSERLAPYVVDVSPRKQGRFIPGSGQQIVAPEFLHHHRPASVIIMNSIYRAEIATAISRMGLRAEVLVA
jgi:SAM-dependent methyltransferase